MNQKIKKETLTIGPMRTSTTDVWDMRTTFLTRGTMVINGMLSPRWRRTANGSFPGKDAVVVGEAVGVVVFVRIVVGVVVFVRIVVGVVVFVRILVPKRPSPILILCLYTARTRLRPCLAIGTIWTSRGQSSLGFRAGFRTGFRTGFRVVFRSRFQTMTGIRNSVTFGFLWCNEGNKIVQGVHESEIFSTKKEEKGRKRGVGEKWGKKMNVEGVTCSIPGLGMMQEAKWNRTLEKKRKGG